MLLAADEAGRQIGQPVLCCVRPERIELCERSSAQSTAADDAQPARANNARSAVASLRATVAESIYLGEMRQYLCDLPGSQRWKISVLAGADKAIPAGSAVTLRIAAQDVALLPA